jgi:predicted aminopeptidase
VAYRGYYSKEDAMAYAEELRKEGDDVQVGGVPAYSTLGWFSDPLLSTFINYSDAELARMVFHELAHQVVYIPGDSRFNEAFASAVEEAGVDRWLELYGNEAMREAYVRYSMRRKEFLALLVTHRQMLAELYASKASVKKKREGKARIFASLHKEYDVLKASWGGYAGYDRFFAEKLTNAHLAAVATYNDLLPGFKALLAREKTFPRFYAAVQRMSNLPSVERSERLAELARSAAPAPAVTVVAEKEAGTAGGH